MPHQMANMFKHYMKQPISTKGGPITIVITIMARRYDGDCVLSWFSFGMLRRHMRRAVFLKVGPWYASPPASPLRQHDINGLSPLPGPMEHQEVGAARFRAEIERSAHLHTPQALPGLSVGSPRTVTPKETPPKSAVAASVRDHRE